jgi:hypothetical protein
MSTNGLCTAYSRIALDLGGQIADHPQFVCALYVREKTAEKDTRTDTQRHRERERERDRESASLHLWTWVFVSLP